MIHLRKIAFIIALLLISPLINVAYADTVPPPIVGSKVDYVTGQYPGGATFDNVTNSIWLVSSFPKVISKVNIFTGVKIDYPLDQYTGGIAFDNVTNSIWVTNSASTTVSKINIYSGTKTDYMVSQIPYSIAFDNVTNSVWVTNMATTTISKISIYDGSETDYVIGDDPRFIAFDNITDSIWVVNSRPGVVSKVSIFTGAETDYAVGQYPGSMAFDSVTKSIWVPNGFPGMLSRIDIFTGTRTDYPMDDNISGVAFDNITNSIWAANYLSSTVSNVDINTGARIDYATGSFPSSVAFDNVTNSIWVTNSQSNTVSKMSIGVVAATSTVPTFSTLAQFKSDKITTIPESATTTESTVVFSATLSDANNYQTKLQVELKDATQPFDGVNLLESDLVTSGSIATTTKDSLAEGSYHWRARAVDDKGNASEWQEFGTAGNTDFVVQFPLNVKAAELAMQLVKQNYLWGGKGWDVYGNQFVNTDTVKTGYNYWTDTGKVALGNGVDCSGLVAWSYNHSYDPTKFFNNNYIGEPNADKQYKSNMQYTTTSDVGLQPGDLLFFDWDGNGTMDHVAEYVGDQGNFNVVEARNRKLGIATSTIQEADHRDGFIAFGRPKNFVAAMSVTKASPVNLTVTDPSGITISTDTVIPSDEEYIRESGDLTYATMGIDAGGYPEDVVYSPVLKPGTYHVSVTPMANTAPTQTYSLDFNAGSTTINLAHNVPLSQIPSTGYGVVVGQDNTVTLDTTPPEAQITFSTSTKSAIIIGTDTQSLTTQKTIPQYKQTCTKQKKNQCIEYKQIKTGDITTITDVAGNTLSLVTDSQNDGSSSLRLATLKYNTQNATTTTDVSLRYNYHTDRKGNISNFSSIIRTPSLRTFSVYVPRTNETIIFETTLSVKNYKNDTDDDEDENHTDAIQTKPDMYPKQHRNTTMKRVQGMVISHVATNSGNITVEY